MLRPLRTAALVVVVALTATLAASCGGDDEEGAGSGSEANLTGLWQWERTGYSDDTESVPEDPSRYTLEIRDDGTMTAVADCNTSNGTWTSDATDGDVSGSLTIELGPTTLVACEEGSLSDVYLRDLGAAGVFFLRDGALGIDLFADSGTMTFTPAS